MQLDGRFFCSICSESEGNVEATVIQTRMNTSQQDKITSWNHIDRCKKKLQIGILLTDANMFASQLFLCLPNFSCAWPAVNFNRNLSEFNNCVLRTGNSQAKIREQGFAGKGLEGRDYCASELCASKPGKVLRIARYARIANSFVLSVSHLHSHSSRNTDCVCSAGIPVVSVL